MVRPCYLVIDREYAGSISTRKLVIETAKFNVITAYSSREAVETLTKYPALDGVVLDAGMNDMPCEQLVGLLKEIHPGLPVIAVSGPGMDHCGPADHHLESFDPKKLLALLQKLNGPVTLAIEAHEDTLNSQ